MTRRWMLSVASAAGVLIVAGDARGDGRFDRMLSSASAGMTPEPTLEETQEWLQEKTAAHGTTYGGAIRESLGFDGCRALHTHEICDADGRSHCVPAVRSFSLADLRTRATVAVHTARGEDAFTLCFAFDGGEVRARRGGAGGSSAPICFSLRDEQDMRRRYAKALAHAIELCKRRARQDPAGQRAAALPEPDEPF